MSESNLLIYISTVLQRLRIPKNIVVLKGVLGKFRTANSASERLNVHVLSETIILILVEYQ